MTTIQILPKATDKLSPVRTATVRNWVRDARTGREGAWTVAGEFVPASRIAS